MYCRTVMVTNTQVPALRPMANAHYAHDDIKILCAPRGREHRRLYPHATLRKMKLCPLDPWSPTTCEKKLSKLSQRYG